MESAVLKDFLSFLRALNIFGRILGFCMSAPHLLLWEGTIDLHAQMSIMSQFLLCIILKVNHSQGITLTTFQIIQSVHA